MGGHPTDESSMHTSFAGFKECSRIGSTGHSTHQQRARGSLTRSPGAATELNLEKSWTKTKAWRASAAQPRLPREAVSKQSLRFRRQASRALNNEPVLAFAGMNKRRGDNWICLLADFVPPYRGPITPPRWREQRTW